MSSVNQKVYSHLTAEGALSCHIPVDMQLRRAVSSCLLWENSAYEDGVSIAARIADLVHKNDPNFVANLAVAARLEMKLRHVPLLLMRELARHKDGIHPSMRYSDVLATVIQRPDELCEFLALYWKEKKEPLKAQVKKGLAKAFQKFDAYSLAKYNRDNAIKLRDVLFMVHAKPENKEQEAVWKKLVDGTLESPDTWEVALSSGQDKKETWERLLSENKLGALALLRNLRNMNDAKVDQILIQAALNSMKVDKILPFRFISAARYSPKLEPQLESAMMKCLEGMKKLKGKTVLLIDVSGSMDVSLSEKSEMNRIDAACGVAILLRELCDNIDIHTFSNSGVQVAPRHGFALRDAIFSSQPHGGTFLGQAIVASSQVSAPYDRMIVITDEQSHDELPNIGVSNGGKYYMINISAEKNGVGYKGWVHIDGFSESVISFIQEYENLLENMFTL